MENTITFDSPLACLDYVKNIIIQDDILSSVDRKKLFKARQYFVAHLNHFLKEDIKFLLSNESFRKFTNLQVEILITNCNLNNEILPVSLKQWENCEIKILTPYLQKIAETYPEQLESYFSKEKGKNVILDMFHEQKNINSVITDLAITYDPVNVFKSQWKPEKIVQWLDKNPEHYLKITEYFASIFYKDYNPLIKDKIFELVILEHIKNKEIILEQAITPNMPIAVFLTSFGASFIEKFKVLDSDFLDLLVKKPILFVDNSDLSIKNNNPSITLNLAQYTYIEQTKNWQIDKAENIIFHYSKEILSPVEVELNFYTFKENIFSYFFKNNSLDVNFSIGLKQEFSKLNSEDQEIYTASCINLLNKQSNLSERTQKIADLLEVVPIKMANRYFSKALDFLEPDVASMVSSHLLKYSLDKKLSKNSQKYSQIKI